MTTGRRTSLVATCDQWARAHHTHTAVLGDRAVTLAWGEPAAGATTDPADCRARGLAVDRLCRIYRVERTTVTRVSLGSLTAGVDVAGLGEPQQWLEGLVDGSGIAVDDDDRVYVADRGRRTVTVLDLWSRRVLRTVHLTGRPVGLAVDGRTVVVTTESPARLVRFRLSSAPRGRALTGPTDAVPARVCIGPRGLPAVLWQRADGTAALTLEPLDEDAGALPPPLEVGGTADVAADGEGGLLLLGCPDATDVVRRLALVAGTWQPVPPLQARGHDGSGLVVARGRTLFWTEKGPRTAITARVTYEPRGRVVTYRLDAGVARARWGRLFVRACVPAGTDVLVGTVTSDDDELPALTAAAPTSSACPTPPADTSPPAVPAALAPGVVLRRLHRRRDASTAWWRLPEDSHDEVLEAPVAAPPGRWLWVTIELRGDTRHAPVLRELRVEQEAQRLTGMLPAVFGEVTRDDGDGRPGFLEGYLGVVDGLLHDLDVRAAARHVLLDPHATPVEALPWLAGFLGLVLDGRWAESARRQLVAEVAQLYRRRGTVGALSRYLALFLAGDDAQRLAAEGGLPRPVIVEHHRLRGLGSLVGDEGSSRGVLGAGMRVGGELGGEPGGALDGGAVVAEATPDADTTASTTGRCPPEPDERAHRFTVLVPRSLSATEEAAVRHLLDTERPAHTVYDLCTVDAGIRVGRGAHVGLSTMVGPTGGFTALLTGAGGLGTTGVLGGGARGVPATSATPLGTGRLS